MTYYGLIKKAGAVTTEKHLRTLILNYLDEETKRSAPVLSQSIVEGRDASAGLTQPARLAVFGHLLEPGETINGVVSADRAEAVCDRFIQEAGTAAKKCHHLIFSMHPNVVEALKKKRRSPEAALIAAVHETFNTYTARFHPGDSLGYVAGVHKTGGALHSHVVLHPKTGEGHRVRVGRMSSTVLPDGKKCRVDFQGVLQTAFFNACRDLVDPAATIKRKPDEVKRSLAGSQLTAMLVSVQKKGTVPLPADYVTAQAEVQRMTPVTLNALRSGATKSQLTTPAQAVAISESFAARAADIEAATKAASASLALLQELRLSGLNPYYRRQIEQRMVGWVGQAPDGDPAKVYAELAEKYAGHTRAHRKAAGDYQTSVDAESAANQAAFIRAQAATSLLVSYQERTDGVAPSILAANVEPLREEEQLRPGHDDTVARTARLLEARRVFDAARDADTDQSPYRKDGRSEGIDEEPEPFAPPAPKNINPLLIPTESTPDLSRHI